MQHDPWVLVIVSGTAGALILGLGVVLGMWAMYRGSPEARVRRRWRERERRPRGRVVPNSPERLAERARQEGRRGEYVDPNEGIPGYPGER